uniref:Uncharacterized protein n=1 Tax=Panagrellus redivivus TaxID=6233 RepID=A0A7E4ZVG9_PANRE
MEFLSPNSVHNKKGKPPILPPFFDLTIFMQSTPTTKRRVCANPFASEHRANAHPRFRSVGILAVTTLNVKKSRLNQCLLAGDLEGRFRRRFVECKDSDSVTMFVVAFNDGSIAVDI